MFNKLKTIGSVSILLGIILLLAKADELYQLYGLPYILIGAGIIILLISLLATNKEKSLLCRIGFHKFEQMSRDQEIAALFIYRCERCGKEKKVMKAF